MKPISRQTGIGLVELMVALTIAMFLTLGLGLFFYNMSQVAKNVQGLPGSSNQGLSGLQDSERMAMIFLGNAVESAGYYSFPTTSLAPASVMLGFALPASGSFGAGQAVSGTSGAVAGTDTLSIRFTGNGTAGQGCAGNADKNVMYTDTYSVTNNILTCTENGATYNLVNGISGLTVLYGIGSTANAPATGATAGVASVNTYVPASSVGSNWRLVKTVQVSLNFVNPLAGQPNQPAILTFSGIFPVMNGY